MKRVSRKGVIAILSALLVVPVLYAKGRGASRETAQPKLTPAELTSYKSFGSRTAPITIEVFSDYQCPQCRFFWQQTARQLIDNYVATGKVYLVQHDFPLPMHAYSRQAARWANAAAAAGQFQAAEQALYAKQDDWGSTGKIEDALASAVSSADMKKIRYIEATEGPQIDAAIASDVALGDAHHVDGTPSIFVVHDGKTTPLPAGGVNYELLKQYLDYLLHQR